MTELQLADLTNVTGGYLRTTTSMIPAKGTKACAVATARMNRADQAELASSNLLAAHERKIDATRRAAQACDGSFADIITPK